MSYTQILNKISQFVIPRFCLWEACAFLMSFSEYDFAHKVPKQLIFFDIGLLVILGSFMIMSSRFETTSGVFASVYMFFRSFVEFQTSSFNKDLRYLIVLKMCGSAASILFHTIRLDQNRARRRSTRFRLGCFFTSVLCVSLSATLLSNKIIKSNINKYLNSVHPSFKIYVPYFLMFMSVMLLVTSLSIGFNTSSLKDSFKFLSIFWSLFVIPLDISAKQSIPWIKYRLIAADIMTALGFFTVWLNY